MVPFAAAAATGICVDHWLENDIYAIDATDRWKLWLLISVIFALALAFASTKSFIARHCELVCIAVFAGSHAISGSTHEQPALLHILSPQANPCFVNGTVRGEIQVLRNRSFNANWDDEFCTRFNLEVKKIRIGRCFEPMIGTLRVTLRGQHEGIQIGSRITVGGKVQSYRVPHNPGEINRYQLNLDRGIHGHLQCNQPSLLEIETEANQSNFSLWQQINKISRFGIESYFRYLKPTNAAFASAIALGRREHISDATRDQLLVTGTAHLLSVSGLHLGLLLSGFHLIAATLRIPLGRKTYLLIGICIFYSALTGMNPPVLRAAIMVTTWMISLLIGRPSKSANALSLCLFLFLSYDCLLLFDIGVQLSFLAVATILFLIDHFSSLKVSLKCNRSGGITSDRQGHPNTSESHLCRWFIGGLVKSLYLSTGLFLVTTPFLWSHFHVVSPVSILANLVISPLLFFALISSLTLPLACMVHESCGLAVSIPCDFFLDLIHLAVKLFSEMPFGHFWLPSPATGWVIFFYSCLAGVVYFHQQIKVLYFALPIIVTWFVLQFVLCIVQLTSVPMLEVVVLDVGHGTCVVIRDQNSRTWLYDCGSFGQSKFAARVAINALWHMGIFDIQGIFVSHADTDHYNGIQEVLRKFHVGKIYTTDTTLSSPSTILERLFHQAEDQGVSVSTVVSGEVIEAGGCFTVLHPSRMATYESDNASSLVLEIRVSNQSLILTGDIEGDGMLNLMARHPPHHQSITMAPHHGSLGPKTADFIRWSDPKYCIISGRDRSQEQSIKSILNDHIGIFSTHEHHALRIIFTNHGEQILQHWSGKDWKTFTMTD